MAEEKVLNEEIKDEEKVEETLEEEAKKPVSNEESVEEQQDEEPQTEEQEDASDEEKKELSTLAKCLIAFLFPALILIFYVLSGILFEGAWKINWLLFLAIPTYWSGLYAYHKKNWLFFLFPLIVVGVYLFIGFAMPDNKGWHPYWIMFIEIPLYYVAVFLVKVIVENKEEEPLEEPKEEQEEAEKEPEIVEKKPEVVVAPAPVEEKKEEKVVPVVHIKEKKDVSNRRAKKAAQPKEKKVKVVTEKRNYNKEKRHLKIKADITHNNEVLNESENNDVEE